VTQPGIPTPDQILAFVTANPGCRMRDLVAEFAPEGMQPKSGDVYYWTLRNTVTRSGVVYVNRKRWYAKQPNEDEQVNDDTPATVPPGHVCIPEGEYRRLAKAALELKKRVGIAKAATAKFSGGVGMLARDYNQDMRSIEREIVAIANELQLAKVDQ
jgi:hypothetical protein